MPTIPEMIAQANAAADFVKAQNNALLTPVLLNLNTAGSKEVVIQGNFLYVVEATDTSANIQVQFNRQAAEAPSLTISKSFGYVHPFTKLYFSWDAQTGKTATVIVGSFAKEIMDVVDNRSQVDLVATLEEILAELQGSLVPITWGPVAVTSSAGGTEVAAATPTRKSIKLSAHPANTDVIYVGYDDTVSASNYAEILYPGDVFSVDDYRGIVRCIAAVNGEIVAVSEL